MRRHYRLGSLCDIRSGGTPPRSSNANYGGSIPWAKIEDLNTDSGTVSSTKECITEVGLQSIRGRLFEPGTLLFAMYGSVGKMAWAGVRLATNQAILGITVLDPQKLLPNYLKHWLSSRQDDFDRDANGVTQKNLSSGYIRDIEIELPSIEEQRRIASILDRADSLRRKRQEAVRLADDFLRATFFDLVGDPVTNPHGWIERSVLEIGSVTTGNTPDRSIDANFGDAIEWIKSDNINTPSHSLTTAREGLSAQGMKVARIVSEGSTLMTCIAGSPSCIGNVAMADRRVAFNQQINAITPKDGIDPKFLYLLLLFSKPRIQAASTNSMKGMVSKGTLEKVQLIWPPKSHQDRLVEVFDKVATLRTRMEETEQFSLYASLQAELIG